MCFRRTKIFSERKTLTKCLGAQQTTFKALVLTIACAQPLHSYKNPLLIKHVDLLVRTYIALGIF